jgi:protein-S-isoprenylcysteine O-methyltransferase Ste14
MLEKRMKRTLIFLYAIASYLFFLLVLVFAIGFFGNVYVPVTIDSAAAVSTGQALLTNIALILLFGLQHSVMARPAFKRRVSRYMPAAVERSTYVLTSSFALGLIMLFWQPMGGVIWHISNPIAKGVIQSLYLMGWMFMVWATFLINHLDFFGLRQAYCAYRKKWYVAPAFATPAAYRVIRHPIYLGWLVVFWATPVMTICHLMLSAALTAYMAVGICLEERDLVREHPDYAQYQRKVPALFPSFRRHLKRAM